MTFSFFVPLYADTRPYHGWRYGADGLVAAIPAFPSGCPIPDNLWVKSYHCREQDGYVWVCLADRPARELPLKFPYLGDRGWTTFHMKTRFRAAVETCMENFLDCPHATYVHRFWFRSPTAKPVMLSAVCQMGPWLNIFKNLANKA